MGWKDTSRNDVPPPVVNINLSEYSDEQLDAIEAALKALERAKKPAAGASQPGREAPTRH